MVEEIILPEKAFVRWGYIPEDERSQRYDRRKAGRHKGTSCYAASLENGKWRLHDRNLTLIGFETLASLLHPPCRPIFLISGKVVGNGPDNEPLLRKITIIKVLFLSDLTIPHLHDPDEAKILKERREINTWGRKL